MLQALFAKPNSLLKPLKKKGFKEARVTTIGLYDIGKSHDPGIQQEPVVITDVNPYRLAVAKRLGATRAVDVRTDKLHAVMHALGMTEGFDVGREMSGAPSAFNQMLATMNHGGKIALLGLPPKEMRTDWHQIIFKGGSYWIPGSYTISL
jgi:D-arabinose 1-dehydrogenase-like Zn-dependent alcohol dehydrogenase